MKKYKYFPMLALLFALVAGAFSGSAFAQLGGPEGDPDAPIDGGVSLLVAAGVGYGIKKARDQRKKNKSADLQDK